MRIVLKVTLVNKGFDGYIIENSANWCALTEEECGIKRKPMGNRSDTAGGEVSVEQDKHMHHVVYLSPDVSFNTGDFLNPTPPSNPCVSKLARTPAVHVLFVYLYAIYFSF